MIDLTSNLKFFGLCEISKIKHSLIKKNFYQPNKKLKSYERKNFTPELTINWIRFCTLRYTN